MQKPLAARPLGSKPRARIEARGKHWLSASVVAATWALSSVCAAAPSDNVCDKAVSTAEQLRSSGDLAAARARLSACVSAGCPYELQECARQFAAIDAEMPSIVIEARDEAGDYITEARATMDGALLLDRLDGKENLVNPGQHRLTLEAPGFRKVETTFVTREGEKKRRVVLFVSSVRNTVSARPISGSLASPARDQGPGLSVGRKVGLALGGAGLGGLAVGAIFSVVSKVTYDNALSSECTGDPNRCSSAGISAGRRAHDEATVSTIGFVGAGMLLAAGAAFYLTSPEHDVAVAPAVGQSGGGVTVVGKW
jgi:hypothetical protein